MQALILAGGEGLRLRPLTLNIPKPIVPIGNQPFLLRQIDLLKRAGITDIILSLNYQPSAIERVLGDGSKFGVRLKYLIEPKPLGTGGAFKYAQKFLKTSTIVLNGDILTDIDLKSVIEQHKRKKAEATIVLTEVENPADYGLVQLNDDLKVLSFLEKLKQDPASGTNIKTINAGIYIFEPKVLDLIPKDEKYSFEYQLFPDLLKRKISFYGFLARDNYWLDIGTPERYLQAHYDLMGGKIKNLQVAKAPAGNVAESAQIDVRSILAHGCHIKPGAAIINSVLGENVSVAENSIIRNSVIWKGTTIAADSVILDSFIGKDSRIGSNISLRKNSVLGDRSIIYRKSLMNLEQVMANGV